MFRLNKIAISLIVIVFGLAALAGLYYGGVFESGRNEGTLLVGTSADYPAFEYRNAKGDIIGFDIDLVTEIAKRMDKGVIFEDMPWSGLIAALSENRMDLIASAVTHTQQRAKMVDFSHTYFDTDVVVLYKKAKFDGKVLEEMSEPGRRVAVLVGSHMYNWAKNTLKKADLAVVDSTLLGAEELSLGRVEFILVESSQATGIMKKYQFKSYTVDGTGEKLAFAFPKGSKLVAAFNKALMSIKKDGTLEKLRIKWFD